MIINGVPNRGALKPNVKLAIISSYERKIIRLFCCKRSIIIMNISYSSKKRMKGNRKELVMKFVHEYSNIKCDKVKEFDNLKYKSCKNAANCCQSL